jgi:hypothetical protein
MANESPAGPPPTMQILLFLSTGFPFLIRTGAARKAMFRHLFRH